MGWRAPSVAQSAPHALQGPPPAVQGAAEMREPEPDLVLPPLAELPRAPSRDSPFAYETPLRLPPPFTLQPRPQWDDASFSPFNRPTSQSSSPTTPSARRMPYEALMLPPPPGPALPEPQPANLTLPPPHSYTISPHERAADVRPSLVPTHRTPAPPGSPHSPLPSRDDDEESHDHGVAR